MGYDVMLNHPGHSLPKLRQLICAGVLASLTAFAAGAQESSSEEYKIGPGDVLNVFVWREDDLTVTLPVRPDGRISTPLVEDMVAAGKSPSELARDIEEVLSELYISPRVTILVVESVGGSYATQVRVLGEVTNPGSYPYRDGMTLMDALIEAGGLTEFAAGRRAQLSRIVDGELEETRVRVDRLMERGDRRENRPLEPGDVIVVPQARF